MSADIPVPGGDYEGDGEADLALCQSGVWYILLSSTNYTTSVVVPWGLGTDVPVRGLP